MSTTVALLLPTLNEIDGFRAIFPKIDASLFDDILVVDGGSADGTVEFAMAHGLRVMTQIRKGIGFASYDAVCTLTTDAVVVFSLDGNSMPEQLGAVVQKLKTGCDLVTVSRYLPPARSYDDTWITAFGNRMFSFLMRHLGKFPVTDSLNIYRGFRRSLLDYPEMKDFLYGPVFEPLLTALSNARGLSMAEVPGDEPPRIGGKSKMSVVYNGSCILWMVVRIYAWKFRALRQARAVAKAPAAIPIRQAL